MKTNRDPLDEHMARMLLSPNSLAVFYHLYDMKQGS